MAPAGLDRHSKGKRRIGIFGHDFFQSLEPLSALSSILLLVLGLLTVEARSVISMSIS